MSDTALTVMLFAVGEPLTAGVDTVAPSPLATALADIVPETATAAVAPVTLPCATVAGRVTVTALVLNVVGIPEMEIVTTVPLVLTAVAAVSPAGNPDTAKLAAVIEDAYVPLVSVYTMFAPLTACPTFKLPSPVAETSIEGTAAPVVAIAALRCAAPAL